MDVKVSGNWKKGISWVKVSGLWKKEVATWTKVAGVWKKAVAAGYDWSTPWVTSRRFNRGTGDMRRKGANWGLVYMRLTPEQSYLTTSPTINVRLGYQVTLHMGNIRYGSFGTSLKHSELLLEFDKDYMAGKVGFEVEFKGKRRLATQANVPIRTGVKLPTDQFISTNIAEVNAWRDLLWENKQISTDVKIRIVML